jgi:3-deoxy-D-manno-octulosonic-acid transferase
MAGGLNPLERLALRCYSFIMWLLQPMVRRKLLRRAVAEPEYGQRMEERFGRYADAPSAGWVWVHAVSLGETRAAALLVAQLRAREPAMKLLLTHSTASGWAAGRALLGPGDRQGWFPWDTTAASTRFLRHFRPRVGMLLETEVWPNMVQACARHHVPLLLVNARLNPASYTGAVRLNWLSAPAYRCLAGVYAQGRADADKLAALGAVVRGVYGNIKFDAQPASAQLAEGRALRRLAPAPVVMLVSSREGEEAALLAALMSLGPGTWTQEAPRRLCQVLVVPRHPQRVVEVAGLFRQAGFSVSRRTEWGDQPEAADVWLGDSMGELAFYYGMSDVALLGGSFGPFGGQNLIESATCGCPLVMGPHTFNFNDAAQWALDAGAARRAPDMESALALALSWLGQGDAIAQARLCCLSFAGAHRGASARTAEAVLGLAMPPT